MAFSQIKKEYSMLHQFHIPGFGISVAAKQAVETLGFLVFAFSWLQRAGSGRPGLGEKKVRKAGAGQARELKSILTNPRTDATPGFPPL